MKTLKLSLKKLIKVRRKEHHPLIHKLHKKHRISKKTLFYVKEYGQHSNVPRTIIKESIKILLLTSIISSFGGLALEHIKTAFLSMVPLLILLPTLNDMIGDYGTIISSKFSTMLHEGKIHKNIFRNKEVRYLFHQIMLIAVITSIFSYFLALVISYFMSYNLDYSIAIKIFLLVMLDVVLLIIILFFIALAAGLYFYKKNEDPNNFLIPITTSIADLGNMILLTVLFRLFF